MMADKSFFEIPQELRELAEKNVEQARTAYGQYMDFLTQAMSASSRQPTSPMLSGFKAVQEQAVAFAKENAERSFNLASDVARAKDLEEVLALQNKYAQSQMQAYTVQAQELGRIVAETIRETPPQK